MEAYAIGQLVTYTNGNQAQRGYVFWVSFTAQGVAQYGILVAQSLGYPIPADPGQLTPVGTPVYWTFGPK
jgi:hypothetical protein